MRKQLLIGVAAAALAIPTVSIVGAGIASAKGKHHSPAVATGTTTCHFHGTLSAAIGATVSIRGNLTPKQHTKACTSTGGTKLATGHITKSPLVSTATTTGVCTFLAGSTLPDLGGGTIWWSPKPKVAASTGVALTTGAISVVTVGSDAFLQIAYTGGSVAAGSFMNASGASLTAISNDDVASLTAACASGPVSSIAFNGSLTL
jgi:hypothetical protein